VCWPWFGPHPNDPTQPQHGRVRTINWRLVETRESSDGIRVAFEVDEFGARVRLEVVAGAKLSVALTTHNLGSDPLVITEALHTYFHVGDVTRAQIHGLDGARYRDNTDGGIEKTWSGSGPMMRETIAVFEVAPDTAEIVDPVLGRRIRIRREGGRSTVAWHPGANLAPLKDVKPGTERQFACIESGNVWSSAVTVAPGADHRLAVSYEIVAM
jgi:glucose-6-phosphate 1-epimerase